MVHRIVGSTKPNKRSEIKRFRLRNQHIGGWNSRTRNPISHSFLQLHQPKSYRDSFDLGRPVSLLRSCLDVQILSGAKSYALVGIRTLGFSSRKYSTTENDRRDAATPSTEASVRTLSGFGGEGGGRGLLARGGGERALSRQCRRTPVARRWWRDTRRIFGHPYVPRNFGL